MIGASWDAFSSSGKNASRVTGLPGRRAATDGGNPPAKASSNDDEKRPSRLPRHPPVPPHIDDEPRMMARPELLTLIVLRLSSSDSGIASRKLDGFDGRSSPLRRRSSAYVRYSFRSARVMPT